ncbi:hypothetical protein G6F58_013686 [Rhizopus delemar]|nr:hypothetical protein G6F58_013686 [Rhizopus delemar]KAG1470576.1 hypothetical protein G6F54_014530 [Rhizopus delemar]
MAQMEHPRSRPARPGVLAGRGLCRRARLRIPGRTGRRIRRHDVEPEPRRGPACELREFPAHDPALAAASQPSQW